MRQTISSCEYESVEQHWVILKTSLITVLFMTPGMDFTH